MAKLRKGTAYRRLDARPYTRRSKYRKLNFIRATPNNKVVKYTHGKVNAEYKYSFQLISKEALQIRHNALESARQTANKYLETELGRNMFFFNIRIYPHHILRENPIASGAGADRLSTGMQFSFGKPVGLAARVKKGQILMEVKTNNEEVARKTLKRASHKIPCKCSIIEA